MAKLPNDIITRDASATGGVGEYYKRDLLEGVTFDGSVKTFAIITVPPKAEMGLHQHSDDAEIYYIMSGRGCYNDNAVEVEVNPGDAYLCPKGESHAIRNIGDEDLVFVALIAG